MAVLPWGSYLKGSSFNAVYAGVAASRLSEGESGQSEEPLTCARIRGRSLRSCIQCSQGLATACKGCSGLGRHQSAEECIPAPSQVGSLQGAKVQWQCLPEGACFTYRAREGGYSAVSVLRYTSCSFAPAIL